MYHTYQTYKINEGATALMMIKKRYKVHFVTPAFLGNAEQSGAWRIPPFKALLRQWWRVAAAKDHGYNAARLRETEGRLFGNAWLKGNNDESQFYRSKVLLRLDSWSLGNLTSDLWPGGQMEAVSTTRDGKNSVRADVYMGYGPVMPPSKKEGRKNIVIRNAIRTTDSKQLCLGFDKDLSLNLMETMKLIQWFGTLGSRSRNAWGSLFLEPLDEDSPELSVFPQLEDTTLNKICRVWEQCLNENWTHALGTKSGKPLIWITEPKQNWRESLGCLAKIKINMRFTAKNIRGPGGIGGIHFLGYPSGSKWELKNIEKDTRLAGQIRFKILRDSRGFIGMISHFPSKLPNEMMEKLDDRQRYWIDSNKVMVWDKVHETLNREKHLKLLFQD